MSRPTLLRADLSRAGLLLAPQVIRCADDYGATRNRLAHVPGGDEGWPYRHQLRPAQVVSLVTQASPGANPTFLNPRAAEAAST